MNAYKVFLVLSWLAAHAPLWLSYRLAAVTGDLYYWFVPSHSSKADRNMQQVLGAPTITRQVRDIARQSFRNYAKYMVDFLRMTHVDLAYFERTVLSQGWQYIDECLARGKGIVFINTHFGNWDTAAAIVCGRGYTVTTVADALKPKELNDAIQNVRRNWGMTLFSVESALKGLYSSLRRNEIVGIVYDKPLRGEGVPVTFFGRQTWLPSGPAHLVLKTGASVLFGYTVRQPGNTCLYGVIEPPLEFALTGNKEQDVQAITQAIVDAMEKAIRRHPDQWYMFRDMWPSEKEMREMAQKPKSQPRRRATAAADSGAPDVTTPSTAGIVAEK